MTSSLRALRQSLYLTRCAGPRPAAVSAAENDNAAPKGGIVASNSSCLLTIAALPSRRTLALASRRQPAFRRCQLVNVIFSLPV
jgi:hypothetical protein